MLVNDEGYTARGRCPGDNVALVTLLAEWEAAQQAAAGAASRRGRAARRSPDRWPMSDTDSTYQLMRHRVCRMLRVHWDPIGARQMPTLPQDEYASYAQPILDLVETGATDLELSSLLGRIETEQMGLGAGDSEPRLQAVAAIRAALAEPTLPPSTDVDALIETATKRGEASGPDRLSVLERRLFLIDEMETTCDMGNLDLLLDNHPPSFIAAAANSFAWLGADHIAVALRRIHRHLPDRVERELGAACALITARVGYKYSDITAAVTRWGMHG